MQESPGPLLHKNSSILSRLDRKPSKIFTRYRKKLLWQVFIIMFVCFLTIFERVVNDKVADKEEELIVKIQRSMGLQSQQVQDGSVVYVPTGIVSQFVRGLSFLSYYKLQILMMTHLFITLYVAFDAVLAATLLYSTMFVIFLATFLQIIYMQPRPFWVNQDIFSSNCLPSFNHPSRGTLLSFFVIIYTYFLFLERTSSKTSVPFQIRDLFIKISLSILLLLFQLMEYVFGQQHLISIALGIVYFGFFYAVLRFLNTHVDSIVRKSTIMSIDAKRYSFYWLLILGIAQVLLLIIYTNMDKFAETAWIKSFLNCDRYQNITPGSLKYDQIVGAWYVFLQSAVVFGWIGAIFGIAFCFRSIPNLQWYRGTVKQRVMRAIISNILIIPSWLFIIFIQGQENDDTLARRIGINDFIIDSAHFFLLYIWLFGYMPYLIFQKLLKINHTIRHSYYDTHQEGISQQPQIVMVQPNL